MASINFGLGSFSILVVSGLIFVSLPMARPRTAKPAGTSPSEGPLRYRAIALEPKTCQDHDLELELELENTSSRKIAVSPNELTYQVAVTGEERGTSTVADPLRKALPSELKTLSPSESYRRTIRYPLSGNHFPPGIYEIRLTYGQFADPSSTLPDLFRGTAESNAILFQILECGKGDDQ